MIVTVYYVPDTVKVDWPILSAAVNITYCDLLITRGSAGLRWFRYFTLDAFVFSEPAEPHFSLVVKFIWNL